MYGIVQSDLDVQCGEAIVQSQIPCHEVCRESDHFMRQINESVERENGMN